MQTVGFVLDEDNAAILRHVRSIPASGEVRPHREHHAAVADDNQFIIGITTTGFLDRYDDALAHIFVALTVLRAPEPSALRVVARILTRQIAQEVVSLAL